eukprot:SAG22_NODE_469_length_10143_cov_5.595181_4_plen_929_part_00
MPWLEIGKLDRLEEISLWDDGFSGPISAAALCGLTVLRVLAMSQNMLSGQIPECAATQLHLDWLWLEMNRIHGPVSEFSTLGQWLKNINSLNLESNRWAPLLASEKAALEAMADPIGVTERDHDWDFRWHYEWTGVAGDSDEAQLTAERQVSVRRWGARVPVHGFKVGIPFPMKHAGGFAAEVGVGRDGDFVVGSEGDVQLHWNSDPQPDTRSSWGEQGYVGCYQDGGPGQFNGVSSEFDAKLAMPNPSRSACSALCSGYRYYGLQWQNLCFCGNTYGRWGEYEAGQNPMGRTQGCGGERGKYCASQYWDGSKCGGWSAVFAQSVWELSQTFASQLASGTGSTCWSALPSLVPVPHVISDADMAASAQGSAYFSGHFCSDWAKFVQADACGGAEPDCGGASPGNSVFDGGNDMYDVGNFLVTSEMGSCAEDPNDCALGSLRYRGDFEPVDTNCFGAASSYRMAQYETVWVFLSHNSADAPLDFMVFGNLGSDGSGTVTEFVLEADPFVGFVKRECGGDDPSVNHLIIVDGSGGLPTHACDYEQGGACTGASSDLDDDILQGISPGSPILYLLYSSEDGYCVKEDEHRAIFDAAVRCLWADDPFAAVHTNGQTDDQPLVDVDVDERGQVVFGGTAAYTGWAMGQMPEIVPGPGGADNAMRFGEGRSLQLGDTGGVLISGNFTLECRVHITDAAEGAAAAGTLLALAYGDEILDITSGVLDVGGRLSAGWYRLAVHHIFAVEDIARVATLHRHVFIDGIEDGGQRTSVGVPFCDGDGACAGVGRAVGSASDGTAPFPLELHVFRLRLHPGILDPNITAAADNRFEPLVYHSENSRWVEISRGLDGVDITWSTFGWERAAHANVQISLEPAGGIRLAAGNASMLWNRAMASAGAVTDDSPAVSNWTTAALNTSGAIGIRIDYVDSDPCFDL